MTNSVYNVATKDYLFSLYFDKKLSLPEMQKTFKQEHGLEVSIGFLSGQVKSHNAVLRTSSEARRLQ